MKFIRVLFFSLFMAPFVASGASNDFMLAAQLLAAAKSADIQQVQALVNNGANVNFVDSTGLSIVCTALMNNDVRAAQILQMYGADASNCDRQIKNFNNKNKPKGGGGLFSGLSSAQSISLAAAGAAVVVGGLFLLTDVFDPGNDNDSTGGGGDRPNNNPGGDGSSGGGASQAFAKLPYGPACNATTGQCDDVNLWSLGAFAYDFDFMKPFNYLMMAYAYNSMARGYMGLETIRLSSDKAPYDLSGLPFPGDPLEGGRPVGVAAITASGVNATGSLADGWLNWADESQVNAAQANCVLYGSGSVKCINAVASLTKQSRKFFNRSNLADLTDLAEREGFDFSGHNTVFGSASEQDTVSAKVIAGWNPGAGDYYGFVPNAQLTVYRTGGGLALDSVVGASGNQSGATDWATGDTFTLNGVEYQITLDGDEFTATDLADEDNSLSGVVNGTTLNFAQNGTNYEALFNGNVNSLKTIDLMNYSAMLNAANLRDSGEPVVGVIANLALNPQNTNLGYLTMSDFKAGLSVSGASTNAAQRTAYKNYINLYYNLDASNDDTVDSPGMDAESLYAVVGSNQNQIIVNSVGAYEYGVGDGKSIAALEATFENYAPVIWTDMEHLFASVVAVELSGTGTSNVGSVSDYTGPDTSVGKIQLAKWDAGYNDNGTPDNKDDTTYSSRKCGDAGLGLNGVDPWCFAAPGENSEMAVASMAGAIASVQSAFGYLDNDEIFALLALTADGAYLGTNPNTGKIWATTPEQAKTELVSYLQGRYNLPGEYSPETDDEYLTAFKEVFGYGLINLERATKPGTSVYYYNGNNIVSSDGNAYWRAATNTVFKPSAVLNLRGATIRAPFFDVLENIDGTVSLPRVWENEFAFGADDKRGLYMGDVLGEFTTRRENAQRNQIGALGLSVSFSERAYNDNLNGLDNLSLDYAVGNWNFGASYQHYLTDGVSRFSGLANPVLGLMSNAVVSDIAYNSGKWSFGARAFSGAITDEGLLENDPTISAQYMPARLGLMQGGAANVSWAGNRFAFTGTVGSAHETNTVLGALSDGLLDLGAGNTIYADAYAYYKLSDDIDLTARATFAHTVSDASGDFIVGLSDIDSNAFAFGANVGNFEFSVSQPLAITNGALRYAYAEYDVVKMDKNKYELNVVDTYVENLSLRPEKRETRLMGTYRHKFGEFTDGAFGFIYRINPNHTDDFGNESIFILKMSHRLGV
jgi:hypothetical protein